MWVFRKGLIYGRNDFNMLCVDVMYSREAPCISVIDFDLSMVTKVI